MREHAIDGAAVQRFVGPLATPELKQRSDQVLRNVRAAAEANGRVFNLGSDGVISLRDLAALIVELNGAGEFAVREFPENRKRIDIGDYYADHSSIRDTLGWEPRTPLREALARTLAFYRENIHHYV